MFFDTHAHYDDPRYDADRETLLSSMRENGVDLILNAGSGLAESRVGLALAETYPFVYAAIGVHPHEAASLAAPGAFDDLRDMLKSPRAVAVGEIGLDYHYDDAAPPEEQKRRFIEQLDLARELQKPVVIHERDAFADVLEIITRYGDLRGVVHCFSGDWDAAKRVLDLGWYISFTGVVTFKNGKTAREVAARLPLDRLMLETDAPYLSPEPRRGARNDSMNLHYIAERLAQERGVSAEELARATKENGMKFFGITPA